MHCTCDTDIDDPGCQVHYPNYPLPNNEESPNSKLLGTFVKLGYLSGYRITKRYEDPGIEMRTSEEITLEFPMGASLTISGVSSGTMENVSLELVPGHVLTQK